MEIQMMRFQKRNGLRNFTPLSEQEMQASQYIVDLAQVSQRIPHNLQTNPNLQTQVTKIKTIFDAFSNQIDDGRGTFTLYENINENDLKLLRQKLLSYAPHPFSLIAQSPTGLVFAMLVLNDVVRQNANKNIDMPLLIDSIFSTIELNIRSNNGSFFRNIDSAKPSGIKSFLFQCLTLIFGNISTLPITIDSLLLDPSKQYIYDKNVTYKFLFDYLNGIVQIPLILSSPANTNNTNSDTNLPTNTNNTNSDTSLPTNTNNTNSDTSLPTNTNNTNSDTSPPPNNDHTFEEQQIIRDASKGVTPNISPNSTTPSYFDGSKDNQTNKQNKTSSMLIKGGIGLLLIGGCYYLLKKKKGQ